MRKGKDREKKERTEKEKNRRRTEKEKNRERKNRERTEKEGEGGREGECMAGWMAGKCKQKYSGVRWIFSHFQSTYR